MKLFSTKRFDELIIKDTVAQFFEERFQISESENIIGLMLMIRQIALLERLATDKVLGMKVAVVGEDAIAIAKEYLCVMNAEEADVINIDFEHFTSVKKRMKIFQDTQPIFVSNDLENRNHQKKIRDVIGVIDCGYLEGEKVRISGVFCMKRITKSVPIDEMIIIDASKIKSLEGSELFAKFQHLTITGIVKSGMVWIEKLRKQVEYFSRNKNGESEWGPILNAIKNLILNLFDDDEIGYSLHKKLSRLLDAGIKEIECQLARHGSMLVEMFREQVVSLVEEGIIAVADRYNVPDNQNSYIIYCDDDYYYFVKDIFDLICKNSAIDEKSILFIKQWLADQEMNKMYRTSSGNKRELNIDISIVLKGIKVYLSVYAIKKEFFDEIGGIALYERGSDIA